MTQLFNANTLGCACLIWDSIRVAPWLSLFMDQYPSWTSFAVYICWHPPAKSQIQNHRSLALVRLQHTLWDFTEYGAWKHEKGLRVDFFSTLSSSLLRRVIQSSLGAKWKKRAFMWNWDSWIPLWRQLWNRLSWGTCLKTLSKVAFCLLCFFSGFTSEKVSASDL